MIWSRFLFFIAFVYIITNRNSEFFLSLIQSSEQHINFRFQISWRKFGH